MLEAVYLQNYLFFKKLTLELGAGLNIFTGETGAGKSILVNAIKIACGQKYKNNVHLEKNKPVVVLLRFVNLSEDFKNFLNEIDFEHASDTNELIIRRSISANNVSKYFVNDILCTQKFVKLITSKLVEFTSQNNTLKLLESGYQQNILNSFIPQTLLQHLKDTYRCYAESNRKLEQFRCVQEKAMQEEDYLKFVAQELEALSTHEGEENELLENIKLLKKHKNSVESINTLNVELESVHNSFNTLEKQLQTLGIIGSDSANSTKQEEFLCNMRSNLEEFEASHSIFCEQFVHASENYKLEELEDRLYLLREYSRKYRVPVHELCDFLSKIQQKLSSLTNCKKLLESLEQECAKNSKLYIELAINMYEMRQKAAKTLETLVNNSLKDLNMEFAALRIKVVHSAEKYSENGADSVVFEIRTNTGKDFENLADIASGGELSRIMLAIKSSIKSKDGLLYIFDEIDTGISGSTATSVGRKLKTLSTENQLIVITHQPQVAVFANFHFQVCKSSNVDSTQISFLNVSGEEQMNEIARMLSGKTISNASKNAAKSLISQI